MLYKKTEKLSIIKREGEIMGMFVNPNAAAFQCAQMRGLYVRVVLADSGNLLL